MPHVSELEILEPSARAVSDAHITDALRATVGTPEGMYGRRKMTAYLRRQGRRVAGCTVDRLMRDEGLSGVIRGRKHRTTIAAAIPSRTRVSANACQPTIAREKQSTTNAT